MKPEDFERLKAICEKEGFDVLNLTHDDNEKYILVKKAKDEWEGVEFVKSLDNSYQAFTKGKIYKIRTLKDNYGNIGVFVDDKGSVTNGWHISNLKPSTEQAYVDQLKDEAFELYGDIKEWDEFDRSDMNIDSIDDIAKCESNKFTYFKKDDCLEFGHIIIYSKGKWAKKIEKVRVEWKDTSRNYISFSYYNSNTNLVHRGNELAEVLEKYLNQ